MLLKTKKMFTEDINYKIVQETKIKLALVWAAVSSEFMMFISPLKESRLG